MRDKRHSKKNVFPALILFFLIIFPCSLNSKKISPAFIGIDACKKCHDSNSIGNQFKIWASSPHAKAFQILNSPDAYKIGEKSNIQRPDTSTSCLKCHTTGGGKTDAVKNEGVGCEACHGPGSIYYEFENHASFISRENSYRKARTLGMYPILGVNGIKAREKLCRYCHSDTRPCLPESNEARQREKLPLSLIANFVFKHPVRR